MVDRPPNRPSPSQILASFAFLLASTDEADQWRLYFFSQFIYSFICLFISSLSFFPRKAFCFVSFFGFGFYGLTDQMENYRSITIHYRLIRNTPRWWSPEWSEHHFFLNNFYETLVSWLVAIEFRSNAGETVRLHLFPNKWKKTKKSTVQTAAGMAEEEFWVEEQNICSKKNKQKKQKKNARTRAAGQAESPKTKEKKRRKISK